MNKLVSIAIINHNNDNYLPRCLDSCLKQDYHNIEIIVIDDGSGDNSLNILKAYSARYHNIYYYANTNHGISYSRNYAIDILKGEYFIFLDSDDYIDHNMISSMIKYMRDDIDLVICGFRNDYENFTFYRQNPINSSYSGIEALHKLMSNTAINNYPWNKLYKTALFRGIKFPLNLSGFEDIATIYKYYARCRKVKTLPDRFYHYVQHGGSYTNHMNLKYTLDMWDEFIRQEKALNEMFKNEHFDTTPNKYRSMMCILYALLKEEKELDSNFTLPAYDRCKIIAPLRLAEDILRQAVELKFKRKIYYKERIVL